MLSIKTRLKHIRNLRYAIACDSKTNCRWLFSDDYHNSLLIRLKLPHPNHFRLCHTRAPSLWWTPTSANLCQLGVPNERTFQTFSFEIGPSLWWLNRPSCCFGFCSSCRFPCIDGDHVLYNLGKTHALLCTCWSCDGWSYSKHTGIAPRQACRLEIAQNPDDTSQQHTLGHCRDVCHNVNNR